MRPQTKRRVKGLVLEVYTDRVFKLSFIKLLTSQTLETVKLPTVINDCKYGHLIGPNSLIDGEVTKTKKNWILTTVIKSRSLIKLKTFEDYLKFSEMVRGLKDFIKEGEHTNTLSFVEKTFARNTIDQISLQEFQEKLSTNLGW